MHACNNKVNSADKTDATLHPHVKALKSHAHDASHCIREDMDKVIASCACHLRAFTCGWNVYPWFLFGGYAILSHGVLCSCGLNLAPQIGIGISPVGIPYKSGYVYSLPTLLLLQMILLEIKLPTDLTADPLGCECPMHQV